MFKQGPKDNLAMLEPKLQQTLVKFRSVVVVLVVLLGAYKKAN